MSRFESYHCNFFAISVTMSQFFRMTMLVCFLPWVKIWDYCVLSW